MAFNLQRRPRQKDLSPKQLYTTFARGTTFWPSHKTNGFLTYRVANRRNQNGSIRRPHVGLDTVGEGYDTITVVKVL